MSPRYSLFRSYQIIWTYRHFISGGLHTKRFVGGWRWKNGLVHFHWLADHCRLYGKQLEAVRIRLKFTERVRGHGAKKQLQYHCEKDGGSLVTQASLSGAALWTWIAWATVDNHYLQPLESPMKKSSDAMHHRRNYQRAEASASYNDSDSCSW